MDAILERHKKQIEKTYKDLCDISRQETHKDQYKKSKHGWVDKYLGQKCRLCNGTSTTPKSKNGGVEQNQKRKLIIDTYPMIKPGDKIVVTVNGRLYTFIAGLPNIYDTHQEVPLEYKEMT